MEASQDNIPIALEQDQNAGGFFDDVSITPEWLTQTYVEDALKNYSKDPQLKITKYSVTSCTKPGDNYLGVIFRASVSYESRGQVKTESLIMKVEPFVEGPKKGIMSSMPLFETEGRVYTHILPAMQELLKNIKDSEIIAPNLIHYAAEPAILILQDMAIDNFLMHEKQISFENASIVARKLGKFHALSYFMVEDRHENIVESFQNGLFTEDSCKELGFVQVRHDVLCEVVRGWGLDKLADKLVALKPFVMKKLVEISKPKTGALKVLNHGDFHIKNLLLNFNNDKSSIEDIRFIDFQISAYGTPAIDLAYLLHLIADSECSAINRDQLLVEYHNEFTNTLNNLGFLGKIPSLLDFQVELLRNGFMEYFVATNFLSLYNMNIDALSHLDFSDPSMMSEISRITFEGPAFKAILQRLLPQLMNKGVLEI